MMSLFPAYAVPDNELSSKTNCLDNDDQGGDRPSWLNIESFPVNLCDIPLPSFSEAPRSNVICQLDTAKEDHVEGKDVRSEKKKKNKRKHKDHKKCNEKTADVINVHDESETFCEDKVGVKGYLSVNTLTRPLVPNYRINYKILGYNPFAKNKKKKKEERYYLVVPEDLEKMAHSNENSSSDPSDGWKGFELEEELTKKTSDFNKTLAEDPNKIDVWLEYVKFQDDVQQFEQNFRKGSSAKSIRIATERKICILDKALNENPLNEILLQERFYHAERLYPADTLATQLKQTVEKSPGNISIWRSYIRVTQGSLSLCNTQAVMKLYDEGMKKMNQMRRGAPSASVLPMENGILDLLLECGLFLRQAGLWEQLWTLLRMYLELNLAQPDSDLFKMSATVPEDFITGLEDTIISSQLPLPELWYRVERLREGAHWLPWSSEAECEDPQRLVFVDDVSDMLHPITTGKLAIRLAFIVMTLLKVPLLPSRHTTMQLVGLDLIPSNLDCIEVLLAMYYPQNILTLSDSSFLEGALNLVYGPQYLTSSWPGQEHYLEFVTNVFHSCAQCLKEPDRTAMFLWWLRFERYLVILDKFGLCKLPTTKRKKTKSSIKEFLKNENNRNNSLFYVEYALFELAMDQEDSALKVLNTAVLAQASMPVMAIGCERKKAELCKLHRTLCEILLKKKEESDNKEDGRDKPVAVLLALVLGIPVTQFMSSSDKTKDIETAINKFRHITTELFISDDDHEIADGTENLLPDFLVDWTACYAWLLYLTRSVWEAGVIFEEALQKIPPAETSKSLPVLRTTCQREGIYENYIGLLYHHCRNNSGVYPVLQETLHRALQEFPNNLHLLAIIANIETTVGSSTCSWWKLSKYFQEGNCVLAQIFQIFFMRYRSGLLQLATQHGNEYLKTGGPTVPDTSMKNRLSALYSRLLNDTFSKRCPMLWRLYLRFLAEHGLEGSYHSTFYRAVEECPWVKVLYVEAVKLLPAELPRLQDLLIEKELRIHVTPDELDILRSDPSEVL